MICYTAVLLQTLEFRLTSLEVSHELTLLLLRRKKLGSIVGGSLSQKGISTSARCVLKCVPSKDLKGTHFADMNPEQQDALEHQMRSSGRAWEFFHIYLSLLCFFLTVPPGCLQRIRVVLENKVPCL